MKKDIHPKWYPHCQVACSCGNTFTLGATIPSIHVEICNKCHPFFTGQQKFVDALGRVQKFQLKQKKASALKQKLLGKKIKRKEGKEGPKTLKEMLQQIK